MNRRNNHGYIRLDPKLTDKLEELLGHIPTEQDIQRHGRIVTTGYPGWGEYRWKEQALFVVVSTELVRCE